jgi:hypothetical protein
MAGGDVRDAAVRGAAGRPAAPAVTAPGWPDREAALVTAAELLLAAQRERGLPTPAAGVTPFFDRPYRTVDAAVPRTLLAGLTDPLLVALPAVIGAAEQWVDSVDVLYHPEHRAGLLASYRAWSAAPPPAAMPPAGPAPSAS